MILKVKKSLKYIIYKNWLKSLTDNGDERLIT